MMSAVIGRAAVVVAAAAAAMLSGAPGTGRASAAPVQGLGLASVTCAGAGGCDAVAGRYPAGPGSLRGTAMTRSAVQATVTTLSSSASLAVTGQPVTYTATVTPTDNGGSVSFGANDTRIPGCAARPLSSGRATCRVTYRTGGLRTITANYTGDAGYGPSYSGPVYTTVYRPLGPGTTSCAGVYGGRGQDVIVPAGARCALIGGTVVSQDVTVGQGARFSCQGASIGRDLRVSRAAGIGLQGCRVGRDARLTGLTGDGPGGGASYLCDSSIGHDLTVQDGAVHAAEVEIGGLPCDGAAGDAIGHDLTVRDNAEVAVTGNRVGHDLTVRGNTAPGSVVSANTAGHDATCQDNTPPVTGSGNTAAGRNDGCPA